jgi:hypothetical protein
MAISVMKIVTSHFWLERCSLISVSITQKHTKKQKHKQNKALKRIEIIDLEAIER